MADMRVHFICNGNAYRSRMAEAYLKSLHTDLQVVSSGAIADQNRIRNDPVVIEFTDNFLRQQGVKAELPLHPAQLTQKMIKSEDVIIIMNKIVERNIRQAGIDMPHNVRVWDITDVDEQDEENGEVLGIEDHTAKMFEEIKYEIDLLVRELKAV
jgi:protein-tyrosine-phosphatase